MSTDGSRYSKCFLWKGGYYQTYYISDVLQEYTIHAYFFNLKLGVGSQGPKGFIFEFEGELGLFGENDKFNDYNTMTIPAALLGIRFGQAF